MIRQPDLRGINNLGADYYWYAKNGKPDRKRGIHVHEVWFVNVQHMLNDSDHYVRASELDVLAYRLVLCWASRLTFDQWLALLGLVLAAIALLK